MEQTKNRWESKTLQGAIVTIIGLVVAQVSPSITQNDISAVISAIFTVVGVGMTVYGRVVAEKKIVRGK